MVPGKLPIPGRPTTFDNSVRAYRGTSRCGWGLFSLVYHFYLLFPSLGDGPI